MKNTPEDTIINIVLNILQLTKPDNVRNSSNLEDLLNVVKKETDDLMFLILGIGESDIDSTYRGIYGFRGENGLSTDFLMHWNFLNATIHSDLEEIRNYYSKKFTIKETLMYFHFLLSHSAVFDKRKEKDFKFKL